MIKNVKNRSHDFKIKSWTSEKKLKNYLANPLIKTI